MYLEKIEHRWKGWFRWWCGYNWCKWVSWSKRFWVVVPQLRSQNAEVFDSRWSRHVLFLWRVRQPDRADLSSHTAWIMADRSDRLLAASWAGNSAVRVILSTTESWKRALRTSNLYQIYIESKSSSSILHPLSCPMAGAEQISFFFFLVSGILMTKKWYRCNHWQKIGIQVKLG